MNTTSMEQTIDTIHAMRRQEELAYSSSIRDYLSCLPRKAVDAVCRSAMAKWCFDIAGHCDYEKETIAIAMNCVDRFMSTPSGKDILLDRDLYQLAVMTGLYSSVKIHEREAMSPALVSALSQGKHTKEAVEAMESKMLNAISWRVNPPTAMSFVRSMLDLVNDDILLASEKKIILEYAEFQIEMVVAEYDFCAFSASSIAFACLLNAMDTIIGDVPSDLDRMVGTILMVDDSSVADLRTALYDLSSSAANDILLSAKSNYTERRTTSSYSSRKRTSISSTSSPRAVTETLQ